MRDEYNPYEDANWGQRKSKRPMVWKNTFLRVYMEKLQKGWPATMAAVAARRAEAAEKKDVANVALSGSPREQLG